MYHENATMKGHPPDVLMSLDWYRSSTKEETRVDGYQLVIFDPTLHTIPQAREAYISPLTLNMS
jgi:hypothetical protein